MGARGQRQEQDRLQLNGRTLTRLCDAQGEIEGAGVARSVCAASPSSVLTTILTRVAVPSPPRRPGVPLRDRPVSVDQGSSAPSLPPPRVRHVWVAAPQPEGAGSSWAAGVLLRWEGGSDGIRGQVAFVVEDDRGGPVLVTQVLPAEMIRPVEAAPPQG